MLPLAGLGLHCDELKEISERKHDYLHWCSKVLHIDVV